MLDIWGISIAMVLALTLYCQWYGLVPKSNYSAAATGMVVGLCLGGAFGSHGLGVDELTGMVFGLLVGRAIDNRRKRATNPLV